MWIVVLTNNKTFTYRHEIKNMEVNDKIMMAASMKSIILLLNIDIVK